MSDRPASHHQTHSCQPEIPRPVSSSHYIHLNKTVPLLQHALRNRDIPFHRANNKVRVFLLHTASTSTSTLSITHSQCTDDVRCADDVTTQPATVDLQSLPAPAEGQVISLFLPAPHMSYLSNIFPHSSLSLCEDCTIIHTIINTHASPHPRILSSSLPFTPRTYLQQLSPVTNFQQQLPNTLTVHTATAPSGQVLSTAGYPQFPPSPSHCFHSVLYQQTLCSTHIQLHDHQQLHSGFGHHSYPSPFSCMTLIHFNFPQAADTIRAPTLTSPYIFSHPSPLHYLQGAPHNQ